MTEAKSLSKYLYSLPDERIAKHPLPDRTASKLLVYKDQTITDKVFKDVAEVVPKGAELFFNNTKVIRARLIFFKATGARIEIFLTDPVSPSSDFQITLGSQKACTWKCMIGNAKKWKDDHILDHELVIDGEEVTVHARLENREEHLVTFTWEEPVSFSAIVESMGTVPLPPYLNREAQPEDVQRYQTIFSKLDGAVAAPTAGLHFTDQTLSELKSSGCNVNYLTLHVSAGTFQPIKTDDFTEHRMHVEKIIITRDNLKSLLAPDRKVIAVGTTAMRTLESVYWYGVKLLENDQAPFLIEKMVPYSLPAEQLPSTHSALKAVLDKMTVAKVDALHGETEIFIFPGYTFKVCTGLFTNFHLPGSTLILLVSAFIGEDWRTIYEHALKQDYRFLSYGDTSLLLPG